MYFRRDCRGSFDGIVMFCVCVCGRRIDVLLGKPGTRGGFHSEICFLYTFKLYVIIRIENSNSIAAITRILTHTNGRGVFFFFK